MSTVALTGLLMLVLLPALLMAALTSPWFALVVGTALMAVAAFVRLGSEHRVVRFLCGVYGLGAVVWGVVRLVVVA